MTSHHLEIINPILVKIDEITLPSLLPISFNSIMLYMKDDVVSYIIGTVHYDQSKNEISDDRGKFTIDIMDKDKSTFEIIAFDPDSKESLKAVVGLSMNTLKGKRFAFSRLKVNVWETKMNLIYKDGSDVEEYTQGL